MPLSTGHSAGAGSGARFREAPVRGLDSGQLVGGNTLRADMEHDMAARSAPSRGTSTQLPSSLLREKRAGMQTR